MLGFAAMRGQGLDEDPNLLVIWDESLGQPGGRENWLRPGEKHLTSLRLLIQRISWHILKSLNLSGYIPARPV